MVLKASINLCVFWLSFIFNSFFTKNHFLIAEMNLTTQGPLYTCLVLTLLFTSNGKFTFTTCCFIILGTPHTDQNAVGDPFKTLFVGRIVSHDSPLL